MKILLKQIFACMLCSVSLINAGSGSSAALGAFGGAAVGSLITQPRRERTVVVQTAGSDISRNEIASLEKSLRDQIYNLEARARKDLESFYDRLRAAEEKIRDLESQLAKSNPVDVKPVKKQVEPVDIEPIEDMEERELE